MEKYKWTWPLFITCYLTQLKPFECSLLKVAEHKIKGGLINAALVCYKAHLLSDWQKIILGKTLKLHGTVEICQEFSSLLSFFEKATSI